MAHSLLTVILRRLTVAACPPGAERSDAELLRTFAATHDEAAFAELLRRYGRLVWNVCRRQVRHEQDAEEAFQAAFLVFAQRAGSIRKSSSLSSWLYGVALRTGHAARRRAAKHEQQPPSPATTTTPDPALEVASGELCAAILDEVGRLPQRYRAPLVLCGLEGRTKAEAARVLSWKEGTVSGRLARARELLRRRLARRGLTAPAAALATLPAVPVAVRAATLQAVRSVSAGVSASSAASLIAQEVISAMTATRIHVGVVGVLALIVAVAAGVAFFHASAREQPEEPRPPLVAAPGTATWQEAARLHGATWGHAILSPDGRALATFGDDGNHVAFWDVDTWKEQARYDIRQRYGSNYLANLPFAADGRTVALAGSVPVDGQQQRRWEVTLIDTATGRERGRVPGKELAFSPAGKIAAVRHGDAVTLWDVEAAKEIRTLPAGKPLQTHFTSLAFARDGSLLYSVSAEGGKLFEVATGALRGTPAGFLPLFSSDGRTLATFQPGPQIHLWDTASGQRRASLRGFETPGCVCAFSPDSRLLLTSGWTDFRMKPDGEFEIVRPNQPIKTQKADLDVRLWDVATGQEVARLPGRIRLHRHGHFTPDGRTVAYQRLSGREEEMEVVLWDVATRKERLVLREAGGIEVQLISPDGSTLLGTIGYRNSDRDSFRMWDIATGRELPRPPRAEALSGPSYIAAHSSDGKTLVIPSVLPGGKVGQAPKYEMRVYRLSTEPLVLVTRGAPPPPEPEESTPATEPKLTTPAEREWQALNKDNEASNREFADQWPEAKSPEQQQALGQKRLDAVARFAARALEIARKHPEAPAAVEALAFALRSTSGGTEGTMAELGRAAVALAKQNYLNGAEFGKVAPWLTHQQRDDAEELLQTAFERSPHRAVRGRAAFWLARALTQQAEAARILKMMPELADRAAVQPRPAALARLRATDPDAVERRAERLYEVLTKEYADVPEQEERPEDTVGPAAARALFGLRNLALGKTAPAIDGADLDGNKLRLSDYRGKVVVLLFCGDWCGPCKAMKPHLRAMVDKLSGQPFALLEVNSDEDRGDVKDRMKAEGNPWRCWFDGGKDGPIHRRWNVTGWPTVFVLDAHGVIRYKELRDQPLEQAVVKLLQEQGQK